MVASDLEASSWFAGPAARPDAFKLIRLLGIGGESEVWLAYDEPGDQPAGRPRRVAVKLFHDNAEIPPHADWPACYDAIKGVCNPVMARVFDVFSGPGPHPRDKSHGNAAGQRRYLVMEYVDGPTLFDWLVDHPGAAFHERMEILRTLAYGLDRLHAGVTGPGPMVHGDVKPENIKLAGGGDVKLVDFGLTAGYPSRSDTRIGVTFPYAAPELYTGGRATIFTDRYAFAVTATCLLTGQLPAADRSNGRIALAVARSLLDLSPLTRQRQSLVQALLDGLSPEAGARPACLEICGSGPAAPRPGSLPRPAGNGEPLIPITSPRWRNTVWPEAPPPAPVSVTTGAGPPPLPAAGWPAGPPPPPGAGVPPLSSYLSPWAPPPYLPPYPQPLPPGYPREQPPPVGAAPPSREDEAPGAAPPGPDRLRGRAGRYMASATARYYSSLWTMSDIAAPLLTLAAITVISIILQGPGSLAQPSVALILLVIAAGALITSVQCGFYAKLYARTPAEPDHDTSAYDEARANVWVNRARRTYSLGIVLLWAGIAVALLPRDGSPVRLAATAVAGAMALLEVAWIMAPIFS
jgi:serine/threonine protein kinase